MTLAGNSFHENDTALTFAEWIASRPEATRPDDLAEQARSARLFVVSGALL